MIEELQEILNKEGDLEIYEEILDGTENTGVWYSVDPVVRYRSEVQIRTNCDLPLPNKFVSLE